MQHAAHAACFGDFAHPAALAAEVPYALKAVEPVRAAWPQMEGWINFPLFNQTGDAEDLRLEMYAGAGRMTPHAAQMPATRGVVSALRDAGLAIKQARIAILDPRSALRCHVDMYPAARLIMPLNAEGSAHRHVFGSACISMRPGELWGVDGDVCHGAANVAESGHRVALLVDADLEASSLPDWYTAPWKIPDNRRVARARWSGVPYDTEAEWHLAPFEYQLTPEEAYAHLVAWCRLHGQAERAEFWASHACVCVPA